VTHRSALNRHQPLNTQSYPETSFFLQSSSHRAATVSPLLLPNSSPSLRNEFLCSHCMRARVGAGPTWWRQRATAEDLVPSLLLLLASPLYSCVSSGVTNCTARASLLLPSTTLLLPSATLLRYMPSSYNFCSHRVASQHLWSDKIFPPIYQFPILQTCFGRRAAYLWRLLLYYINTSIALRQVVSSATIEVLWLG
jgi:hypothetical protein